MCHELISFNLDKFKKKHFQTLENVIGNGSVIGNGVFYLMLVALVVKPSKFWKAQFGL